MELGISMKKYIRMISFLIKTILILTMLPPVSDPVSTPSVICYRDRTFSTNRVLETSPGLFSIMNFNVISHVSGKSGDYHDGAILPVKTKIRLFGDGQALGKTIYVNSCPVQVTGIVKDVPERSCLSCDLIIIRSEKELSVKALTDIRCIIIQ
jgi:hypothetical protein